MTSPGLCECGCGKRASRRFIRGHNARRPDRYRIEDRGYVTPCWVWQLALHGAGYGRQGNGLAHRAYYERARGPIPEGLELDHLCRIRACVNPDHLEPVTSAENTRRSPSMKLTAADVAEVRRMIAVGLANVAIAERFGIARSTVSKIKTGARWAT